MDIAALTAFIAVADHGSFSIAARQLFLTQSAVSKRISSLEQSMGVQLFDRTGNTTVPTEAGQLLLQSARSILNEAQRAKERIASLNSTVSGRLRIGTSHHVGIHRLPPSLRSFTVAYPDVELDLRFMDSELACEQVEMGELEVAVVTLPQNDNPRLTTTPVWPDPLVIVAPSDHALATAQNINPTALAEHAAVLPARETITRQILEAALDPFHIPVNVTLETNYLETIRMMVSVGLGWSVLPVAMTDKDVVALDIDGINMHRTLGIVQQKSRTLTRAAASFIDILT